LVTRETAAFAPSVEEDELDGAGVGSVGFDEDEEEALHEVEDEEVDDETGVDLEDDLDVDEEDES
jgi:hypothetical protein